MRTDSVDPAAVAPGARLLAARVREEMAFRCAVRCGDDIYVGTNQGVLVVSGGKSNHVKLKGEEMQAAGAGPGGVWFVGEEHLVLVERGKKNTTKLSRKDFGLASGVGTAVLVDESDVWIGRRDTGAESPLAWMDVAGRRVVSFQQARKALGSTVRGIARFREQVVVVTDESLQWPARNGVLVRGLPLTAAGKAHGDPSVRGLVSEAAPLRRARLMVDAGFAWLDGEQLVGRDARGMFLLRSPGGPPMDPWPLRLSLLGTGMVRMGAVVLVASPLGLLRWDGEEVRLLGREPVVALLEGDPVVAVTRSAVVALVEEAGDAPAFAGDPMEMLPELAREALASGGPMARSTALEVLSPAAAQGELALLLDGLADPAPEVRIQACQIVQRLKILAARPALERLMEDPHPRVRGRAIQALLSMGDASAAGRMVDSLRYLDPDEARRMLRELSAGGGRAAVDVLRPFVLDDRPVVRRSALLLLGKLAFPQPLLGAIAQLERAQVEERVRGAENLAVLEDPLVVYLLAAHLADPAEEVRRASLCSLAQLPERLALPDQIHPVIMASLEAAMAKWPDDQAVNIAVAQLASRLGQALSLPLLESTLRNPHAAARLTAVGIAERQRRRELVPALIERLEDPDLEVRGAAVDALGRIGDPRALAPLMRVLDDPRTFHLQMAGETGNRAVSRSMARILSADVPVEVELGDHDAWAIWYRDRLAPMLARFGIRSR